MISVIISASCQPSFQKGWGHRYDVVVVVDIFILNTNYINFNLDYLRGKRMLSWGNITSKQSWYLPRRSTIIMSEHFSKFFLNKNILQKSLIVCFLRQEYCYGQRANEYSNYILLVSEPDVESKKWEGDEDANTGQRWHDNIILHRFPVWRYLATWKISGVNNEEILSKKIEGIVTLFFTEVTPWVVTSVITSFGVNIEWTGRDSTRWVVNLG